MVTPEIGGLLRLAIDNEYYVISKVANFIHTSPHTHKKIPILQVWGLNLKNKFSGLIYQGRPEDFPKRIKIYRSADSGVVYNSP